jgi:N-methylhydantoinase B
MSSVALGGVREDGSAWTYYETVGGGCGAGPGWQGASAVQCHMTNTLNTPAEAIEMQYPLRVEAFEVRRGSGGAGKWAGGNGIVRRLRALAACEGTLLSDRRAGRPYGLNGGGPGAAGEDAAGGRRLGGKARFTLLPGDALEVATPGGGGWEKP